MTQFKFAQWAIWAGLNLIQLVPAILLAST